MKGTQKFAEELISDCYVKINDGAFGKDDDFDTGAFREDLEEIADNIDFVHDDLPF